MATSMSIKLEFVAPLPQIAITRFTYNAVEFYGPQAPRTKEVDLYLYHHMSCVMRKSAFCIKERHRSAGWLCYCAADPCLIVQSLYSLNLNFQAYCHFLWLYSPICVGPGEKSEARFSHVAAHKLARVEHDS